MHNVRLISDLDNHAYTNQPMVEWEMLTGERYWEAFNTEEEREKALDKQAEYNNERREEIDKILHEQNLYWPRYYANQILDKLKEKFIFAKWDKFFDEIRIEMLMDIPFRDYELEEIKKIFNEHNKYIEEKKKIQPASFTLGDILKGVL